MRARIASVPVAAATPGRAAAACAVVAALLCLAHPTAASDLPHWGENFPNTCQDCHSAHNAAGMSLTNREGNANLCLTCHASFGMVWSSSHQAVPGVGGTSHRWDAAADQPARGASLPGDHEMFVRLDGGTNLMCSTCHDEHSQRNAPADPLAPTTPGQPGRHFLRKDNSADGLCLECHSALEGAPGTARAWTGDALPHPTGADLVGDSMFFSPPNDIDGRPQVSGWSGIATGGSTTALRDDTASWPDLVGQVVRITSGGNAGETRTVESMTGADQIHFEALQSAVTSGARYEIDSDGNVSNNLVLLDAGGANYTSGKVSCSSCHSVHFGDSNPNTYDDATSEGGDGYLLRRGRDDTTCQGCHHVLTHSSATTSDRYGTWGESFTCLTCHGVHDCTNVALINDVVATPYSGSRSVDLRSISGGVEPHGLVDSQSPGNGICEVCHTRTRNSAPHTAGTANFTAGQTSVTCAGDCQWPGDIAANWEIRRAADPPSADTAVASVSATEITLVQGYLGTTASGSEYLAVNPRFQNNGQGRGASGNEHYSGDCLACHSHQNGFGHGGGGSGSCADCHGHDDGYDSREYFGSTHSHSTHTDDDADDARGPALACDACHDTSYFPAFKSGTDSDGSGHYELDETDVCDACHSSGGSYDGVNDPVLGAKPNWDSGIYSGARPTAGKEKWCATCHDEAPSQIYGVVAPDVVGDENGAYTYGTGWGYFKTGHGLAVGQNYPSKGGVETVSGRPLYCDTCHDYSTDHVDGLARSYDDGDSVATDPSLYRIGYRLNLVGGQEPMRVPLPANTGNTADNYRLCAQSGCHAAGPFTDSANMNTNLVTDGVNRHQEHLVLNNQAIYPSDWSGSHNSRINCVACHDVHGSTRLAMVRDGNLIGAQPGVQIWYKNDAITVFSTANSNPPEPEALPLSASDGTVWIGLSSGNLCTHCHGNGNAWGEDREPFQNVEQTPTLAWIDEPGYGSDGADPDSRASAGVFNFKVSYTDLNNDAPGSIELWIDLDDDAVYAPTEKYALTQLEVGDADFTNGKIYGIALAVAVARVGDGVVRYRFFASDGKADADGPPTGDSTIVVLNGAPVLDWTGEPRFVGDGVNPNAGGSGSSFEFRIDYLDADDEPPTSIQVWVDENDNDLYEAGEKYAMTGVDADTTYTDGKRYSRSLNLAHAGDGHLSYRFYASDGLAVAAGEATANAVVAVLAGTNSPPFLEFIEASCTTDGVRPAVGADGADFAFSVMYTDPDSQCPPAAGDIQVWVDADDSGTFEAGEKHDLSPVDPGDVTCSDGKAYSLTLGLSAAGDGSLAYRFYGFDGTDTAIGDPAGEFAVMVTNALKVRSSGGAGWYDSIQAAVDAVNGAHTVLVYEGTYYENILFNGANDADTVVRSVCGPQATTIRGTAAVVMFQNNTGNLLDGFELTGGTTGVYFNGAHATVNDCRIHGISGGTGAVYTSNSASSMALANSQVYGNTRNSGAGILINGGTGHTITNSTIHQNSAVHDDDYSGWGGGLFVQNADLVVTDTVVRDNTASRGGAGIYNNGSTVRLVRTTVTGNVASGAGGALYLTNASSSASLENCIVAGNEASQAGMAYVNGGAFDVVNTTIADNRATSGNSGAIFNQNATSTIRNSIVWGNVAAAGGHIAYLNGGSMLLGDCVIASGGDGKFTNVPYFDGNVTPIVSGYASQRDPRFVGGGNYHLQASSDGVDHADGAVAPAEDIDGQSRPQGEADDIGADEYLSAGDAPALSWTGESGYASDGVDPNSAVGGAAFTFRVDYTDAGNDPPLSIEIWVDSDDNGAYSSAEKHHLDATDGGDDDYTDGKRYSTTLVLTHGGDGALAYRFYATDGSSDASGAPAADSLVAVGNNVPALNWTGEADYLGDGVHPNSAAGGSVFAFRIDYSDADNAPPASIQVWVDENDSGLYDAGEKYDLVATDGGDDNCADGKRYAKSLALSFAGDGALHYRFFASDGTDDASGAATANSTVTVVDNVPVLSWTGEAGYGADGVSPDSGNSGAVFTFRVDFSDADNAAPASVQVWVDSDDDDAYAAGEKHDLIETDGGDHDYTDGKRYSADLVFGYSGDGVYRYRFFASDGSAAAVGDPTSDQTVTVLNVANNAPTLSWSPAACRSEGVRPPAGSAGADFQFLVNYTDADGQCAVSIQVWIDENDDATYAAGEKYNLLATDGGDIDCTDGKLYAMTRTLSQAGDAVLTYRFYASDGVDPAGGAPATGGEVGVHGGLTVRPSGSALAYDYTSIQTAVDNSSSGDTVVVYPNDDFSAASYGAVLVGSSKNNRTILGACGAELTTISGGAYPVTFQDSTSCVLDGFSLTGAGSYGMRFLRAHSGLIRNSRIFGNSSGIEVNDSNPAGVQSCLIYGNSSRGLFSGYATSTVNISDSQIYQNGGASSQGAGLMIQDGVATVSDSIIRDNPASGSASLGGGVYLLRSKTGTTFTRTTIEANRATNGGGVNTNAAVASFDKCTIAGNVAVTSAGAVYVGNSTVNLTNTVIADNQAGKAGAFYMNAGALLFDNTTFAGNHATSGNGGVFAVCNLTSLTVRNSIFWNNTASAQGHNAYKECGGSNGYMTVLDSDVSTGAGYFDGKSPATGGDMIDPAQDPLFFGGGDYHIQSGSPVIDRANNSYAPADDLDGDTRPRTVGDPADMGADEYVP